MMSGRIDPVPQKATVCRQVSTTGTREITGKEVAEVNIRAMLIVAEYNLQKAGIYTYS